MDKAVSGHEIVIQKIRPHWVLLLSTSLWYALAILVPLLWVNVAKDSRFFHSLSATTIIVSGILYFSIITLLYAYALFSWRSSQGYLTNERLVVTKKKLNRQTIWGVPLQKIEKAVITYPSRLAELFHIGTITFKVDRESLVLHDIAYPESLARRIIDTVEGVKVAPQPVIVPQPEPILPVVLDEQPLLSSVTDAEVATEPTTWFDQPYVLAETAKAEQPVIPTTTELVEPMYSVETDEAIELAEGVAVYL